MIGKSAEGLKHGVENKMQAAVMVVVPRADGGDGDLSKSDLTKNRQ